MRNLLIEASAGTGKTQALGLRLVEMLRAGVRPQDIVALTFSRAAAGEIFERFVSLLADGAATGHADAMLLRSVVATQHLSQIGTLDSFLMRVLRAFPLELGLSGELEVMDDHETSRRRAEVASSILRRTDGATKKAFVDAFLLAMNREDVRSFAEAYRGFVSEWHERMKAAPSASAWGDPVAIWGRDPAFAHVTERELSVAADGLAGLFEGEAWSDFAGWVRDFRGRLGSVRGIAKKLLDSEDAFTGDAIEFEFRRRKYSLTRDQTLRVRDALMCVFGYVVRMKLELARGVYRLIDEFETVYDANVRRAGRLVFADVPRLISSLPEASRLALEYRMDARISAWALDEFQDTSREQWGAIGNLVDEAKQSDGEKSVFIVGDRKQAIYGWRNGDVGIFRGEKDSGAYEIVGRNKTYRSGRAVVEAVNRVFARGRIFDEFPEWECPEHDTARPEIVGFVRTMDAPGRSMEDFVEPVFVALKAALGEKESDPRRRGVTAAVLVRRNAFGELLADRLKAMGFEGIVWEGERNVLDTPALSGFLDLVQLADHPGDMLAYRHFKLTPLAAAMYPQGVPPAAEISREMALSFTERGIVRTFRSLRSRLPEDPAAAWSRFTEERFTDMLRAAADFELALSAGTRLADFPSYLEAKRRRTVGEEGKVKVMTIHRSKGLGFDYVVLPLQESEPLNAEPGGPLVGRGWVLPDPGARVAKAVGGLDDAYRMRRARAEQEALCTYYVAMTRAKQAMTLVLSPEASSIRFSDLVRSADLGSLVNPDEKLSCLARAAAPAARPDTPRQEFRRGPRPHVRRRLPSQRFQTGMSAGLLFMGGGGRNAALARGEAAHAEFERIEWIAEADARNGFERALAKPADFVALWREKPFECFSGGAWTSGRFDRVVFYGAQGALRAEVQDFKTDRPRRGESAEEFSGRMLSEYSGQMNAYRSAVSALAGLPEANVSARLLLASTGEAVDVPPGK